MNDYKLFVVVAFDKATVGQSVSPQMAFRFAEMWEQMEINLLLAVWGME